MDEEEHLNRFGTPLEPLEKGKHYKKEPIEAQL